MGPRVDNDTSRLAVITARGGSKRIPRKNLRSFEGRPIIAWVIEAALGSDLFDEVMVSTDDAEIADVAGERGAIVPFFREPSNADDYATTTDVLHEVLGAYRARSRRFTHACCLYPTAPFVTPELLKEGWRALRDGECDTVFPIVRFPSPVERAFRRHVSGRVERIAPEHERTRSQDLEPAFYDAGQFYWFVVEPFLQKGCLLGPNAIGLVVDEGTVHDIDEKRDWLVAERKYRSLVCGS